MNLSKRNCGIKMRLVPYGGGWTDVYADFGDGELYFIISNTTGDADFGTFMRALYYLSPDSRSYEEDYNLVDYKEGICEYMDGKYVVTKIVDNTDGMDLPLTIRPIPWKTHFSWYEEPSASNWVIEREPTEDSSFDVKISIDICRNETKHYEYTVRYDDLCYAVADACTKALKKHGFLGYCSATYTDNINLRYFLFLKAVALRNMEVCDLTFYDGKGEGETGSFEKEIELLLFDM